jgi:hemolysin activation/secretion protein
MFFGTLLLGAAGMLGTVSEVVAQNDSSLRRGTGPQRPEYAEPALTPVPERQQQILPPVPPPSPQEQELSSTVRVLVTRIVLVGNTVFAEEELVRIIAPYENKRITIGELQELRHKLSLHYFNNGYVNSGVIIPDQQVSDGLVRLRAVEGELTSIDFRGNQRLKPAYVSERIMLGAGKPLNIETLQETLSLLQQDPLIKQINAQLQPGFQPGQSVLRVRIVEATPYQVVLGVDNERSPAVGGEQARITAVHRNVTGRGDRASTQLSSTGDLTDLILAYEFPLNARGTIVEAYYSQTESNVIEEPFDLLDIENESKSLEFSLAHPFTRTLSTTLAGSVGLEAKHSETFLLGEPFSFSPGVQDGESDVSVVRLSLDWTRRTRTAALALGNTFRVGVDAFGSTINDDAPDSEFITWQGQLQYAKRLEILNSQIVLRSFAQLASDPLLPIEKFAVGGATTVRGYREAQFVRDNGVVASFEWRFPVFPDEGGTFRLQLAPFADFGRSWDEDDSLPTSNAAEISSVGFGFLWDPTPAWHAQLFYGYALDEVPNPGSDDLQDDGIHFLLDYSVF